MKLKRFTTALLLSITATVGFVMEARDLKDIFSGSGDMIANVMEGVLSKSDLKVEDLAGVWVSSGPAVCFQSDNLLEKAGGIAAAAAIESKLAPYYRQYGLDGAVFTIEKDGNFSLKLKKITLKGTIRQADGKKGSFICNFSVLGIMSLGNVNMYVQKTSKSMDIMFDATKLKQLISAIANLTGNSLAQTLGKVLDSYEGLCVGFALDKTGDVTDSGNNADKKSGSDNSKQQTGSSSGNSSNSIKSGLESLGNILKEKSSKK